MFDTRSAIVRSAILLAAIGSSAHAQQGGVSNFCVSGANGAQISATGSADFGVNGGSGDLVLHADGLPLNTFGMFIQGNAVTQPIPLGGGFRCVGGTPQIWRLGLVGSGPSGTRVRFALDYLDMPAAAQITPGSTWNFQFWFRDGSTSDLTDALEVQFVAPQSFGGHNVVYSSSYTGHSLGQTSDGGALILDDAAEFQAFWDEHASIFFGGLPAPQIDFTQETAIAVFLGLRSTSGYTIDVQDVALSVTTVYPTTLETAPGLDCNVIFVFTSQMQLVTVPRVEEATLGTWTRNQAITNCP